MHLCCGKETTENPGSCRVCTSCGGDYDIVSGQMAVGRSDWWWYAKGYGNSCSGTSMNHYYSSSKYLCCKQK